MKYFYLLAIAFILGCSIQSLDAMSLKQRTAIIKGLKIKGIVGENNKGYLAFKAKNDAFVKVVNEENRYRTQIYAEIAKKRSVSVEQVGKERARQMADQSPKGTWLQKADGSWYKKQ